jgi:hypothetical protein
LLVSLDFNWQITNPEGKVIVDGKSSGRPLWQDRVDGDAIPLVYFHPFALGDYAFTCTVTTGAPALAGLEQRLICQYQPCGLEMLATVFCTGIGIAALVIAGIILLVVRAITKRKKRIQTTMSLTQLATLAGHDGRSPRRDDEMAMARIR